MGLTFRLAPAEDALAALRRSWNGEIPKTIADLRFQVGRYEDMVLTATSAGGYGNLALADAARRLSLVSISYFIVLHPEYYLEVAQILGDRRIRLLDCPATTDMIADELEISPPSGGWHLSQNRSQLESLLHSNGSSVSREAGRLLVSPPGPEKLMTQRDVNFLLIRLTYDEELETSTLRCFMEFLRRGGDPSVAGSFQRVIDTQHERFPFPSTGVTGPWVEVGALIDRAQKWNGRPIPFSLVVGDEESSPLVK